MKLISLDQAHSEFDGTSGYLLEASKMLAITGLPWVDHSWHNDVCPHVACVAGGVPMILWFDDFPGEAADVSGPRFYLQVALGSITSELEEISQKLYEGGSWFGVLAAINEAVQAPNRVPVPAGMDCYGQFLSSDQAATSAREWVRQVVLRGMDYHFDDSAFDQVKTGSGGEKAFTRLEAQCLTAWVTMFNSGYKIDLCQLYFDVLAERGLYSEETGVLHWQGVAEKLIAKPVDLVTAEPVTDGQRMAMARKLIDDAQILLMQCDKRIDAPLMHYWFDGVKHELTLRIEHPETK